VSRQRDPADSCVTPSSVATHWAINEYRVPLLRGISISSPLPVPSRLVLPASPAHVVWVSPRQAMRSFPSRGSDDFIAILHANQDAFRGPARWARSRSDRCWACSSCSAPSCRSPHCRDHRAPRGDHNRPPPHGFHFVKPVFLRLDGRAFWSAGLSTRPFLYLAGRMRSHRRRRPAPRSTNILMHGESVLIAASTQFQHTALL